MLRRKETAIGNIDCPVLNHIYCCAIKMKYKSFIVGRSRNGCNWVLQWGFDQQ